MSKWCIFKCDRCGNEERRGEGWPIICFKCKNNDIEETMRAYKWECYNGHENYVKGYGFSVFDICEECERMKLKNGGDNERQNSSFRTNKNNICLPFFGNKKENKKDNDCCNIF